MTKGQIETMEEIALPKLKSVWALREKENYKFLEIFKADTIKQIKMKEKVRKEHI